MLKTRCEYIPIRSSSASMPPMALIIGYSFLFAQWYVAYAINIANTTFKNMFMRIPTESTEMDHHLNMLLIYYGVYRRKSLPCEYALHSRFGKTVCGY